MKTTWFVSIVTILVSVGVVGSYGVEPVDDVVDFTTLQTTDLTNQGYFEDFESDDHGWGADNGIWEVGRPTVGPSRPYSGSNSAATVLSGNYPQLPRNPDTPNTVISLFISPIISLPNIADNENLQLSFQSSHSYHTADYGQVQIKRRGGSWVNLGSRFTGLNSNVWSNNILDISNYSGDEIQIAFRHFSDYEDKSGIWEDSIDKGFVIDDVRIFLTVRTVVESTEEFIPWKQTSVTGPENRREAAMAYDPNNERTLMFGGWDGVNIYGDLWEWDGEQWNVLSNTGVTPRYGAVMAYDSNRERLVLFGGNSAAGSLNDTWQFDGVEWTQMNLSNTPPARTHAAMVHDSANKTMVLFGGQDGLKRYGDTWSFDGGTWSQIASDGPAPRAFCGMAFNTSSKNIILFGGKDLSNFFGDIWQFANEQWEEIESDPSPSGRTAFNSVAYDSSRNRVVLYGGADADGALGDTWEWDGTNWWFVSETGPYNRDGSAVAYDSTRDKMVLFGGGNSFINVAALGDTWEYQPGDKIASTWESPLESEDEYTRLPGGFGGLPSGQIKIGLIPAKPGFSNGFGAEITTQPGQVEMMLFPKFQVGDNVLLLRVSFQASAPGAALALAALDGSQDGSVATNIPDNSEIFLDDYKRSVLIYDPPTNEVNPIIQVSNVGNSEEVTVYVDNLEVYLLPRDKHRRFYGE